MSNFKRVWNHLRRGPFQGLAAILAAVFVFLMATSFIFLMLVLNGAVQYFESRPELSAFLKDDADKAKVEKVIDELRRINGVRRVKYVSKEEALQIYRRLNKDNPLLLEMVTADVLPASLEVSATTPEVLQIAAQKLDQHRSLFEDIYFPQQIVNFLSKFTTVLRWVGLGLLIFLFLYSLIIIMVVLGMKIALFSNEIEVLRLLGASSAYIARPFILEGILYSFLGFLLGSGGLSLLIFLFRQALIATLRRILIPLPDWRWFIFALAGEFFFALLVGFLASLLAVKRYLR